jgi:hypothetical protein
LVVDAITTNRRFLRFLVILDSYNSIACMLVNHAA